MKKGKIFITTLLCVVVAAAGIIYAADHIDAPSVTNKPTDITDVYVFRAEDPNNMVFVANTQGLLTPGATAEAKFDENTMIELNIPGHDTFAGTNVMSIVVEVPKSLLNSNGTINVWAETKTANGSTSVN